MPIDDSDVTLKLKRIQLEAEEREAERIAASYNLPYLSSGSLSPQLEALRMVSETEARNAKAAAIKLQKKELVLVVENPKLAATAQLIERLRNSGYLINLYAVSFSTLKRLWEHYSEIIETPHEITSEIEISSSDFAKINGDIKNLDSIRGYCAKFAGLSTTDLLSFIFGAAIVIGASDVHFEAEESLVRLRLRVDGILNDICEFPLENYKQVLNRIKLLAGLKINITDSPQDGRFTIKVGKTEVEIRAAISPSEFGEVIVMRILNPNEIVLSLGELGLRKDDEDVALREIKKPNGMILVTGPTGSGKTTTLYAFLKKVSNPEIKVITIEDPIEYRLVGIEQTQVEAKSGYTFASGLRSILRQDPDVILVGEIRDFETAEIAMNASLTGHLVFSTLHTNNSVGAIPRLIDLGIKPSIIGPALTLIIAQRLVRKICPFCRKQSETTRDLSAKIAKLKKTLPTKVQNYNPTDVVYDAVGCDKCHGGYKGRIGIYELLELTGEYESLINKDATEYSIREFALKKGLVEMQKDGILKVLAGMTTFEEVEKATGPLEW